jgi:hypothetical protein
MGGGIGHLQWRSRCLLSLPEVDSGTGETAVWRSVQAFLVLGSVRLGSVQRLGEWDASADLISFLASYVRNFFVYQSAHGAHGVCASGLEEWPHGLRTKGARAWRVRRGAVMIAA